MIVTCPNCTTRFLVPDDAIGSTGRRVKCGSCGHIWLAVPDNDKPPPPEPGETPPPPPPEPPPEPPQNNDLADTPPAGDQPKRPAITAERSNLPAVIEPRRPWVVWGWVLFVVILLALPVALYFARPFVVETFPQTAPIYQRIDQLTSGDNPADPGPRLTIDALQSRSDQNEDGQPILIVSGVIRNPSEATIRVPPLRADIMDADGNPLQSWGFSVPHRRLAGGVEVTFEQAFINPPAGGVRLAVDFDLDNGDGDE